MKTSIRPLLIVTCCGILSGGTSEAFQIPQISQTRPQNVAKSREMRLDSLDRRQWIASAISAPLLPLLPQLTHAADGTAALEPLEMKSFVDPQGLFALNIPKSFYTLRRTQKGDLPDAKTGKGRRGASIFTGGNMAKAEVVAVERYPIQVLLEDNGISTKEGDDLTSFPKLAKNGKTVADWIVSRREKENPQQSMIGKRSLDNVQLSDDGKELTFSMRAEIDVQKPELLMEELGISQLFRITVAKASLRSNDGNLFVIFASALEQDYTNGVDGPALEEVARSFQALDQSSVAVQ